MIESVRSSGDTHLDWASWEKTEQEIDRGYAEGPYPLADYDLNYHCFTPRFPKWERKDNGTWTARNISDYKRSRGNETVEMSEKYSPEDLNAAWVLTRALKDAYGDEQLGGYRADYQMAYRQDPSDPSQAHLTLEITWHPGRRQVVVIRVKGQSFGGKSTQLNYVRDPAAMCAIGRSWLALLVSHYSDDAWAIEPLQIADQSYDLWVELNSLVGWRIDLPKSPRPEGTFKLLGAQLHLSAAQPFGICHPDRREALIETIKYHKRVQRISGPESATLRGRLGHERSMMWGRFGMAALRPFQERQETSTYNSLNPSIDAALEFWHHTLASDPGRPMPFDVGALELHVTISDGEGTGSVGVGWWRPRNAHHQPRVTRVDVPHEWRDHWKSLHKTVDINEIEAVGPVLALET